MMASYIIMIENEPGCISNASTLSDFQFPHRLFALPTTLSPAARQSEFISGTEQ
jgi:hypothetical protein